MDLSFTLMIGPPITPLMHAITHTFLSITVQGSMLKLNNLEERFKMCTSIIWKELIVLCAKCWQTIAEETFH